jgi:hypothetical protein
MRTADAFVTRRALRNKNARNPYAPNRLSTHFETFLADV